MTGHIEVGLRPEIADLIRNQIGVFRRRRQDPDDDGLWRLRVAASPDGEVARRFSELAEAGVDAQRAADLDALEEHLGDEVIDVDTANAWIRAINQIRLVLGSDLAVTDDDTWRPSPGQEDFGQAVIYDLLTSLQGWLIESVSEAEGL